VRGGVGRGDRAVVARQAVFFVAKMGDRVVAQLSPPATRLREDGLGAGKRGSDVVDSSRGWRAIQSPFSRFSGSGRTVERGPPLWTEGVPSARRLE
jgi:hypothetical protein